MLYFHRMAHSDPYQNRIVGYGEADPADLLANPRNWRIHPKAQQDALEGVLEGVGWVDDVIVNKRTGFVVDGHLRVSLALRHDHPSVPVKYVDLSEEEESLVLATLDPIAAIATADVEKLGFLFEGIETDHEGILALLDDLAHKTGLTYGDVKDIPKEKKDRSLPIDAYFTTSPNSMCCIAVKAGLGYGCQSDKIGGEGSICHYTYSMKGHDLDFIDQNFYNYNHEHHMEILQWVRPKYATVMDIMTPLQAQEAKVKHYPLEQILAWAEEVEALCENVIVIPKYDCFDQIPDRYVFGYSIPTSHGGTPLPIEMFMDRRVHLLGGSWAKQREYLYAFGDAVVSLDNNYIMKTATYGSYTLPDGTTRSVGDDFPAFSSPWTVALTLSLASIATGLRNILGQPIELEYDGQFDER